MTGLDYFTFVVLGLLLTTGLALAFVLGSLPGKIAADRGHPQADAIRVTGWLGLLTFGLLFPVALIWAFTKPTAAEEITTLRDEIDRNDIAGSIRRSKRLRVALLDRQCRYVGGERNAAAAIRFIRKNDVAIFDISRIDDLTNLVAAKYGVPVVQSPRRKAGIPGYAEQFESDDLNDLIERENSEDRILYRWLSEQGGSFVSDGWK